LYIKKKKFIFTLQNQKNVSMKNLKKLKKSDLKTIKGGIVPIGCLNWNPKLRCCRTWDEEHYNNPVCEI